MSRWENGKIITEANPVAEGKGKAQKFVREISNDELIQVVVMSLIVHVCIDCKHSKRRKD